MPYAAKAIIEHEYTSGLLKIWITFHLPMRRSAIPLLTPPVFDWFPPLDLWVLLTDVADYEIVSAEWVDEFTLLLTSEAVATRPTVVTLQYDGPSDHLETAWHKQWEPWGPIVSVDTTLTLFQQGMILLWSGSIASIPSGWNLCDGTNGTPNLSGKFIVGAGNIYNPDNTGGSTTHRHNVNGTVVFSLSAGVVLKQLAPTGNYNPSGNGSLTTASEYASGLPPFYALAYIMKL